MEVTDSETPNCGVSYRDLGPMKLSTVARISHLISVDLYLCASAYQASTVTLKAIVQNFAPLHIQESYVVLTVRLRGLL